MTRKGARAIHRYSCLSIAVVLTIIVSACGGSSRPNITGEWYWQVTTDNPLKGTFTQYVFTEDGSVEIRPYGQPTGKGSYKWVDDSHIQIEIDGYQPVGFEVTLRGGNLILREVVDGKPGPENILTRDRRSP